MIPTLHARVGDIVYIHGSSASRMIRSLTGGLPACLTVTLIDGLVLARSAFHHSMNYRSVGRPRRGAPGRGRRRADATRWRRSPSGSSPAAGTRCARRPRQELKGTRVLALDLDEASAKVRTGPPVDDDEDYELDVWAGVIPLAMQAGAAHARSQAHAGHRALGGRARLGSLKAWLLGAGGWIPSADPRDAVRARP